MGGNNLHISVFNINHKLSLKIRQTGSTSFIDRNLTFRSPPCFEHIVKQYLYQKIGVICTEIVRPNIRHVVMR